MLPCSTHEVVILLLGLLEGHGSACGWCSCGEQTDPCPRNTSTETESNSLGSPFCELRAGSKREKEPSFKRLELPGGCISPLGDLLVRADGLCWWFVGLGCPRPSPGDCCTSAEALGALGLFPIAGLCSSNGRSGRAGDCKVSSLFCSKQQGHLKQAGISPPLSNWIKQRHQGKATDSK